jgi:metal-responsive CopG/Arc/MetJ family transcriptional regulator
MSTIKTAISIQDSLFEQIETTAHELQISRSHLFTLAVEEYLRRRQNERLLQRINLAVEEANQQEKSLPKRPRSGHRKFLEAEW